MPLLITAGAVFLLIIFVSVWRLNALLSLLIVSVVTALALGVPAVKITSVLEHGMGSTLGHIALLFGLGAMLGRLLAGGGGGRRIAFGLVEFFGEKHISWAVITASFIIGISMFFEVGIILMLPIVFAVAREMKVGPLKYGFPMLSAIIATHCFLPPHPGPTVLAGEYGADLGVVLMYGIIVAIPTVVISGILLAGPIRKFMPTAFNKGATGATKTTVANGDAAEQDSEGVHDAQEALSKEWVKATDGHALPSFGISLFTALLPVLLMIFGTLATSLPHNPSWANVIGVFQFFGQPPIALLSAVVVALYTMGWRRGVSTALLMKSCAGSIGAIGMVLLIIGGGGAFKQVLIDGGVGQYVGTLFADKEWSPLVMAWAVAAVLRVSLGAATVAALSASGLVMPLVEGSGVNLALLTLATGVGSTFGSHVNDPGFWVVKEYFGLTLKETFGTWTVLTIVQAILGLGFILIVARFVG